MQAKIKNFDYFYANEIVTPSGVIITVQECSKHHGSVKSTFDRSETEVLGVNAMQKCLSVFDRLLAETILPIHTIFCEIAENGLIGSSKADL